MRSNIVNFLGDYEYTQSLVIIYARDDGHFGAQFKQILRQHLIKHYQGPSKHVVNCIPNDRLSGDTHENLL